MYDILEFCEKGAFKVEYKSLNDVSTIIRGKGLCKDDIGLGNVPIILYGELYTKYNNYINNVFSMTSQDKVNISSIVKYDDILCPISSTTKEAQIGKASVYSLDTPCYLGSDAFILRSDLNSAYLMYILNSKSFEKEKMKCVKGTTVRHLDVNKFSNIKVPIVPLEVQEAIVHILDRFDKYTTDLTNGLPSEIEKRRQQYEYYRDMLLSFESVKAVQTAIKSLFGLLNQGFGEVKKIRECVLSVDKVKWSKTNLEYKYVDLSSVDIDSHSVIDTLLVTKENAPSRAQQIIKENDVLFGTTRPLLNRSCFVNSKLDNQICSTGFSVLRANTNIVLPKWLYYNIQSTTFMNYIGKSQKGAAYPSISDSEVKNYNIYIPSIEKQKIIIEVLDKFEEYIHNLKVGLPYEIEKRKQQYEYYRDKLLSF